MMRRSASRDHRERPEQDGDVEIFVAHTHPLKWRATRATPTRTGFSHITRPDVSRSRHCMQNQAKAGGPRLGGWGENRIASRSAATGRPNVFGGATIKTIAACGRSARLP